MILKSAAYAVVRNVGFSEVPTSEHIRIILHIYTGFKVLTTIEADLIKIVPQLSVISI